jgi:hypothetical protein
MKDSFFNIEEKGGSSTEKREAVFVWTVDLIRESFSNMGERGASSSGRVVGIEFLDGKNDVRGNIKILLLVK